MIRVDQSLAVLLAALSLATTSASADSGQPDEKIQVYFERDSVELTKSAKSVIDTLLDRHPSATFTITGNSDTVGSAEHSMAISEGMALAVALYLIDSGIDPSRYSVRWLGESNLAIPTADEVSEPLNRRVEIEVFKGN